VDGAVKVIGALHAYGEHFDAPGFQPLAPCPLMPRLRPAATYDTLPQRYRDRYKWMVLIILGLGTVAGVLCPSAFNVAVPALAQHFQLGQNQVQCAAIESIAGMIGCMPQTRHTWVKQHEVDAGVRDGISTAEAQRIKS
jgi:hypothetical protein